MISRKIEFENLNNTRDIGGMTGFEGRKILPGKLIRSANLFPASPSDLEKLAALVDTVADFRTDTECEQMPDPRIPGVSYHHIPILDQRTDGVTREKEADEAMWKEILRHPEMARSHMVDVYNDFAGNDYCISQYRKFARLLLDDHSRAVLWHCTAGKDRAGFGTVIVQELLGVSRDDIYADYVFSNENLREQVEGMAENIRKELGPDTAAAWDSVEAMMNTYLAKEEYLDSVYKSIEDLYGNFDGYIEKALGITPEERALIRDKYLEK